MKKITLLIAFMLSLVTMGYGQTVLIDPAAGGGFTSGSTFAANGWTVSNSANNPWIIGTAAATGSMTGNAAYISNTGTALSYDIANYAGNYFYRDVTIPAGETKISLTFNWYGQGESTWDLWQVFTAPTTVTPVGTTTYPGSGASNVPAEIAGATFVGNGNLQGAVQTATYTLPGSLAGTTFRLIFYWKSDNGGGTQPPAAIDNISLTSAPPANYVSIATGNFGDASTWNLNSVPAALDHITVAAGHTVTVNATGQGAANVVVNGTLAYGTTPTSFTVGGNLTVNATGAVNVFNGTTGKTLTVAGNIVNDGSINVSVGTTSAGILSLNGSAVQTIGGTGTFVNNMIRNLSFSNTSTAIPNVNWQFNNISVDYNLTITNAKINLGSNKLTYGTSATSAGNTFSFTGGGFMPGGKFARWWTAAGTGYTTSGPSAIATGAAGRYPFYTPEGQQRIFYIGRTTPTAGGIYAVTFNNVAGFTTGLSIVDGVYTVTDRLNSNFVVTTEGNTPAEASAWVTIFAPDAYYPVNGNSRLVGQSVALSGTNVATTVLPAVQRSGVSAADLTTPTGLYMGINSADIAFTAIASGNWNSPATWNKGVVPTCTDAVTIGAGYNVTVNSAGNVAKGVTIASTATLTVGSGDLTVGCTLNNNVFTNNGTLTVTGGVLNINGNMLHNAGSTFNQSGGDIIVDGNNAGVAANSVASGTSIVQLNSQFINWSGGTLTIVDPHANSTSTDTFNYTNSTAHANAGAGHTVRFGNGVSTDAGGSSTYGFRINTFPGSNRFAMFGNLIIDGGSGTNRFVLTNWSIGSVNLTITAGSNYRDNGNTTYVSGNIVNNGTYTSTSTLYMGSFTNGTAGPSTNAQTFSGTGVYSNNVVPASATANLTSFTINNSNAAGVTLGGPMSVSGTLTLTAGKLVTTTANILTLGTTTAAGTLSGGGTTAYINGPFARTIASGNANTNYITFPVGKTAYAPIFLAPTTTAVTVMKAEAFDANTGTADPGIINLAANRRWEAPVVSGTVTDVKVRLGDANITAVKIPVMAPTATGIYNSSFGSTATYVAGTPNTVQGLNAVLAANYSGFLSFAESNVCSGTPAPGNTIASANNICSGVSVTLSTQNNTVGTGVSYQWQSSVNGTTFTDISGATSSTYVTTPVEALYYRVNVTCSTGPATGTSVPVQVTFSNNLTSVTGATRCGAGSVSLTAAAGVGTIRWYDVATGGTSLATGSPFVTNVTATKTFYANTDVIGTATPGGARVSTAATANTTASEYGLVFNATSGFVLNSVDVYLTGSAGNLVLALKDNGGVQLQTITVAVPAGNATTPVQHTVNLGWNIPVGTGYRLLAMSSPAMVRESALGGFPYAIGSVGSVTSGYITGTSTTYYYFYNWNFTPVCSSPRVAVVATVNTPPAFTLSSNPAPICAGQTTTAVTITAGGADYNTYVWTPSTGVSGNATSGWTFNPAVSTSYSLQASQSGGTLCNAAPVVINVTVNALPTALTAPATVVACAETVVPLTATGGMTIVNPIGSATTKTGDTEELSVFGNRRVNYKIQTIYTAAELLAAGVQPGNISSVTYFIDSMGDAVDNANYTIKIGTTTNSVFANTTYLSDATFTSVYGPSTYVHAVGENTLTFTTPFVWNGTSNIVVQLTYDGIDDINNAQTFYTDLGVNTTLYGYNTPTTGTVSAKRFNTRFNNSFQNPVTWSPVTNLYTNAAGTTPYVAGTNATTVYFKSGTVSPAVAYTATATNASSCITTVVTNVSVTATAAPTATAAQTFCNAGTVADLTATGTALKWYADATGGTVLAPTVALVNGENYFASQTVDGCESLTRAGVVVTINAPAAPAISNNAQVFCNNATVADLLPNGPEIKWYIGTVGGTALATTTALVSGTPYYASQTVNGCEGLLRGMVTATVLVTPAPAVNDVDQVFCNAATVADLLPNDASIKWYAGSTGGMPLASTEVLISGTPYYASQTIDGCEGLLRTEVGVTINVTPAPTGDDEQEFCTSATIADLVATGDVITWYDAETDGTVLTGDIALTDGSVYYASQTIDGCEGLVRFGVTVIIHTVVADAPEDVNVCTEYVLPALTNGAYFTEAGGTGVEVAAGTAITETTTLYVYAQEGTDIVCSDENSFTVTVANIAAPTGDDTQVIEGSVGPDVTVADLQTDPVAGTVTWYASEEDALAGIDALADDTQLAQGATYYATQTVGECTSVEVFAVTVDIVLDRENFDIKAFTFHPNPVKDILNLSYSSDITSVTVFNLLGQKVISQQSHATDVKVDMSSLADGAYVVNVTSGNTVKTIKVIKKQ